MTAIDYEAEYNNRQRVPDHVDIYERWQALSSGYRLASSPKLDQPYGPGERHRYDYFPAADGAPVAVYLHGGYWQRGERRHFSFVARELNAAGISVAVPSYPLCPDVGVMQIVDDIRTCLAALWRATRTHPVVLGHSAGGHLTAAMLATDWKRVEGVPADLVRAGYAISGVFDLAPLIGTSINDAVRLDAETAHAASPLFWPTPPADRRFIAAVGGDESAEFLRQSREMADAWYNAGLNAKSVVMAQTNHFTVVDELRRRNSAMLTDVIALARWAKEG
jgi:arylformamidase